MEDTDLAQLLSRQTRFVRFCHVAECDSTQDLARQDSTGHDGVYWADHQTCGRGRQGRAWHDQSGEDLAVTFRLQKLVLPNPTALAVMVPVAVAHVIQSHCDEGRLRIKWPNDVLIDERKVAGILIDSQTTQDAATHLIGIGININSAVLPEHLEDLATSMAQVAGKPLRRHEILLDLAAQLDAGLQALESGTLNSLLGEFRRQLRLVGEPVEVDAAGTTQAAILQGLDLETITLRRDQNQWTVPLAHVQQIRPVSDESVSD